MNLVPLPAFADNYIWMLHDGSDAIVVDPGDAAPVHAALAHLSLRLAAILVTHHHADHTGGVAELRTATGAAVFGPAGEVIPQPYTALAQGDHAQALGLRFEVIDVPGHTAGHIAYYLPADLPTDQPGNQPSDQAGSATSTTSTSQAAAGKLAPLVFCGDTLFSGGCGRLFEGTPAQMLHSLDALAALPGQTRVCCAHEYTLSNLKFARAVEPHNAQLAQYMAACEARRARGEPTLPSVLDTELLINPFLRSREGTVAQAVRQHAGLDEQSADAEVFAALRQWKNEFR